MKYKTCGKQLDLKFDLKEFPMTSGGYWSAKRYLENNNLMKEFNKELSTDGYSLVYFANQKLKEIDDEKYR